MITTTPSPQERTGVVAAQRGFTLVELLVALLVSGVTLAAAVLVTTQVSRGYTTQSDDALVQEEARFALEWIEELVRVAGSNPYGVTTSNCPAAGTVFQEGWIDPNGDAVLDDIRLQADLGPPNAQLGGAGGVCSEADEDITIAYDAVARTITRLDNNRVPTGVAAAVAFVQVAVTAESPDANPRTGQKATLTLSSEVRVRSR